MAKAPPTRTEQEKEQAEGGARTALRIKCGGETKVLNFEDLGPADDLLARKQTGLPITPFFEEQAFGADSVLIMWWMACRKDGDDRLRYEDVLEKYPTYKSISDAGFEIEALEEDDEEVAEHPLP